VLILAVGLGGSWLWHSRQAAQPQPAEPLSPLAQSAVTLKRSLAPAAPGEILEKVKGLRLQLEQPSLQTTTNPSEARQRKEILAQASDYLSSLQPAMAGHPDVEREVGLALARLGELQFSEDQPDLSDRQAAEASFQGAAKHLGKIAQDSPEDAVVAARLRSVENRLTAMRAAAAMAHVPPTGKAAPDVLAPATAPKVSPKIPSAMAAAKPPAITTPRSDQVAAPSPQKAHPPADSVSTAARPSQNTPAPEDAKKPPEKPAAPASIPAYQPPAQVSPAPVSPPPAPAVPQSGVLHYSGPPIPFNGTVEFPDLPAERLKFSFDTSLWQLLIEKQPNGLKKLILRSKKQGSQTTCDGTWEIVK
jgi:hypothetical protein